MCIPFLHFNNQSFSNETDQINNGTISKGGMGHAEMFLLSAFALFVAITNFALIFGLRRTNKKLTISQKLYIYLSLTDTIVGLICLPYFVMVDVLSVGSCTTQSIGMAMSVYSFGTGLGTFLGISYLRNLAIRKPFNDIQNKTVYSILVLWNIYILLKSTFTFFTYDPRYTSYSLYCSYWIYVGLVTTIEVLLIIILNSWSRRALTGKLSNPGNESDAEQRKRKRNQKAVGILNMISLVYTLCTLPFSLYYLLLGVLLITHQNNKQLFNFVYSLFAFIHLPIFLCSGFNALVYMLKDNDIKRYYSCKSCLKRHPSPKTKTKTSTNLTMGSTNASFDSLEMK